MKLLLAAICAAAMIGSAASAATISFSATPTAATANPLGTVISGTFNQNVTEPGLITGVRRSPWEGTPLDGSVYSSITGTAEYVFSSARTKLSLVWGSPDSYNTLHFLNGTTVLGSVTGSQITGGALNRLVTISGFGPFTKVQFVSGLPAFEYANVAAVPVPAAGFMLLAGLAGLAALRRRQSAIAA